MSCYPNVSHLPNAIHQLLEQQAQSQPDKEFLRIDGRCWTFRELNMHALVIAHALRRRGVGGGDHVVVMMQSSELYIALWFAISKIGAVEVPVNSACRGEILRHILRTVKAKVALVDVDYRAQFDTAAQGILAPEAITDPQRGDFVWNEEQIEAIKDSDFGVKPQSSDPACVIFTSGTTGLSKGVVISHHHQLSFGLFFSEVVHFRPEDVAYNFLPFFHIAAKFQTLGAMLSGGRMMLRPVFSVLRFWQDVREGQATLCVAVGGLCHLLNRVPPAPDDANNPMRLIYAVPVPWEFKESFEARFGLQLVEAYGATESNLVIYSRVGENTPRGSCGRASEHFEISIRDERGVETPRGTAGEIWARAREPNTMMTGYLGLPEKTLETMQGDWFRSGDRAFMDENGYVFFLDRMNDAIRRRGENISSFEVERALNAHSSIAEVAVVPVKAEVGEDEVKAVVVLKPGAELSPQALLEFAIQSMPYFMVPRFIEFRADLPRTPTMKVKKVELRNEGCTATTWDCETAGIKITRRGLEKTQPNPTT